MTEKKTQVQQSAEDIETLEILVPALVETINGLGPEISNLLRAQINAKLQTRIAYQAAFPENQNMIPAIREGLRRLLPEQLQPEE
ncbi:hypothetical protein KESI111651_04320 [Kerstersia similis]